MERLLASDCLPRVLLINAIIVLMTEILYAIHRSIHSGARGSRYWMWLFHLIDQIWDVMMFLISSIKSLCRAPLFLGFRSFLRLLGSYSRFVSLLLIYRLYSSYSSQKTSQYANKMVITKLKETTETEWEKDLPGGGGIRLTGYGHWHRSCW